MRPEPAREHEAFVFAAGVAPVIGVLLFPWQVGDAGKVTDSFAKANPQLVLTVGSAKVPIGVPVVDDALAQTRLHLKEADVGLPHRAFLLAEFFYQVLEGILIRVNFVAEIVEELF